MHVRSFLLLTFLLSGMALKAQFYVTPQIGVTFSKITQSNYKTYTFNEYSKWWKETGLCFGVNASKGISRKWKLQIDFFYSEKGSKNKKTHTVTDYELIKVNSKFIDFGLLVSYDFTDRISGYFGPNYGYVISVESYDLSYWDGYSTSDITERHNNELGLNIGVRYTYRNIMLASKYQFGIAGYHDKENNHSIFITLGYRFEI